MKYLATYCLLIAWCGYFLFGQMGPVWTANASANKTSCHLTKATEEKESGCCAKMHKEKKESDDNNKKHDDKDGCGQSDCSLSCCHLTAVILSTVENHLSVRILFKPIFPGIENDLLPNPFLGVVSPPPNC